MQDYICVDLETTGLNPKIDRIIEIGAVKVKDGKVVDTFQSLINPRKVLEERITELTGITREDLEGAPLLDEVYPEFIKFAEDLPLLGHSVLFDYSFLKKAAVDRKETFERYGVDTLKIARKYLPELPSRGLGALCKHYEITHTAHRALGDAQATVELYNRLTELFYAEDSAVFVPEPLIFKVKRDQPALPAQKERLLKILEQAKLRNEKLWKDTIVEGTPSYPGTEIMDEGGQTLPEIEIIGPIDVDGLTRSEASRWIDKLLAKNGNFLYND